MQNEISEYSGLIPMQFTKLARPFHSFFPIRKIIEKCPSPQFDTGCTFCVPELPQDKQIDFTKPLANTKSAAWKHLLILTGDRDGSEWPKRIEDAPESLAHEISKYKRDIFSPVHPIMVSNASLTHLSVNSEKCFSVVLYPDNKVYEIPKEHVEDFMVSHLVPLYDEPQLRELQLNKRKLFRPKVNHHELILICGHAKRDVRCAVMADLLQREFKAVLKSENLLFDETNPKGIKLGMISHIGGHHFAGNVLYFKKDGQSIWYGRVFPEHVQGIVNETIKGGNVIRELFRGM